MSTRTNGLWRAVLALVVVPALLLAGVGTAHAGKPPSKDRTVTAVVNSVDCTTSRPTVTYTVSSARSTADVEIRWRVYTGQILEFGGSYVVQRDRVATNTAHTVKAPSGYSVTSVTVVPVKKNGRSAGASGYAQIPCG